ncbi:dihydroorotase [Candidatus Sumerlaeota bacterium]|nr:dihydroorotase [Candidatus Sumerlaeota bacterium]
MSILIQNGRVIDPASGRDEAMDVLIEDSKIARVAKGIQANADETIDAKNKIVAPGFVDMHVHLREPGREDKENIHSGTRAAAAGGFTSVCAMPNTTPVCDTAQGLQFLASRARDNAVVNILPVAAVTVGQAGEAIVEFGDLVYYGAVAFSDDGNPIMNAEIMCRALEYTSMFNVPILDHCDNVDLSKDGQMRSGANSVRLGLKGIPPASESSQVARDIDLAQYTGGRVHICHVSVRQSVRHVANAKKSGVNVTCEATPHHLTLTDAAMEGYDANFKVNPPLGSEDDRRALIEGLRDGTIDCIATDHAPHTDMEKDNVMTEAPFGVIGLESAFPVLYTDLVLTGEIGLNLLLEKITIAPSRILNLKKGTLAEGADADIVVLDLDEEYAIDPQKFFSRSHNCPFVGKQVKGRPVATIVGGRVVFRDGQIVT